MKLIFSIVIFIFMSHTNLSVLYDAKNGNNLDDWYVVDDGVMGGISQGNIKINNVGYLQFSGTVRTENNGGFSSIRYVFDTKNVSDYTYILLSVKGDGKKYQFRIKEEKEQRYSYSTTFKTTGDWETIKILLADFYPSFRGNRLDKPNFSGQSMEEIAFLIGNKTRESFSLEIEKITLE